MEECPVLKCQAELKDGVRVPVTDSTLRDWQLCTEFVYSFSFIKTILHKTTWKRASTCYMFFFKKSCKLEACPSQRLVRHLFTASELHALTFFRIIIGQNSLHITLQWQCNHMKTRILFWIITLLLEEVSPFCIYEEGGSRGNNNKDTWFATWGTK